MLSCDRFLRVTFRQKYALGFIQRKLDYFFVSNLLQESDNETIVWAVFSTDRSPLLFSLNIRKDKSRGKGLFEHEL